MAIRKPSVAKPFKFSLDISESNKTLLDRLTLSFGQKYGPLINSMINFFGLPKEFMQVLISAAEKEYQRIYLELQLLDDGDYHRGKMENDLATWQHVLALLTGNPHYLPNSGKNGRSHMKSIPLKDGHLIIPRDWIIINPEQTGKCKYAAVVECRNWRHFGVPHFVYLNDFRYGCDYPDGFDEKVYRLCQKNWPEFEKIKALSDKNQLVRDPEDETKFLNVEAYRKAPILGIFHIDVKGEGLCYDDDPPHGAMIVPADLETE